jgi:hypothetical protein
MRRVAEVMAIPAFRRLWTSAYLCCVGDWLSLLGLSSLLATLTGSSEFALSGVVATQLLPGLLLAPRTWPAAPCSCPSRSPALCRPSPLRARLPRDGC